MSALVELEAQQEQTFFSAITEQELKSITDEIVCGKKLKFEYLNSDKLFKLVEEKKLDKENPINLCHMDILQYNLNKIIGQIMNFFPDVKIKKYIKSPCATECKIKQEEFTYKYDLYTVMTKDDKIYEYAYDFFPNLSTVPENKYSHSKTLLDDYQYYISEDINSNKDVERYLNLNLFKLLTAICALNNDEYQLAEILFVQSNKDNKTQKQIMKELGYFLRIINWKKSNEIDIEDLFDECMFTDKETGETISFKKFTKTVNLICDKNDVKYDMKNKISSFEIFEEIVFNINEYFESSTISQYKMVYKKAMKILMDSLVIIIELIKEINKKKTFTPDYINNLIEFHLNEYKYSNVVENIYREKINEKKMLFENLMNEINSYCDKNKHNEDKLDKIRNDFDLLYDNVFSV